MRRQLFDLFDNVIDVVLTPVQRDQVDPVYFADFLFYQRLKRNASIAVVGDQRKMPGTRIQFPNQLYIGFDIIVVDKSGQVFLLAFQIFYVYAFGIPFRYIYITVRQQDGIPADHTAKYRDIPDNAVILGKVGSPSFLSEYDNQAGAVFSLVFAQ